MCRMHVDRTRFILHVVVREIWRNKVHYTDIILHVIHLVIIPYSIDNHARSGICKIQKTMRNQPVEVCHGVKGGVGKGESMYISWMLEDNLRKLRAGERGSV